MSLSCRRYFHKVLKNVFIFSLAQFKTNIFRYTSYFQMDRLLVTRIFIKRFILHTQKGLKTIEANHSVMVLLLRNLRII